MSVITLDYQDRHYVYALLCQDIDGPGYIKFGRSSRVTQRLSQLRTTCPVPARYFAVIEVGAYHICKKLERSLHARFSARKAHGEWFRFDFESPGDKKEFNDGCRECFSEHKTKAKNWTKISIEQLDEYNRERRARFLASKYAKEAMRKREYLRKCKSACKELDRYGT